MLQEQLSLLNQSAPIFAKMEDIFAEIQDSLILLLEELSFMQDFLYSEWKDIIPSLTKMKDGMTDLTKPEEGIEKHIHLPHHTRLQHGEQLFLTQREDSWMVWLISMWKEREW